MLNVEHYVHFQNELALHCITLHYIALLWLVEFSQLCFGLLFIHIFIYILIYVLLQLISCLNILIMTFLSL